MTYPAWAYFPRQRLAPTWVQQFLRVVEDHQGDLDSTTHKTLESDQVAALLRDNLVDIRWQVEAGKKAVDKINRPVLFGDGGRSASNMR